MGKIGRFIDHCCEHHQQLMRAVLERPLAPLESWVAFDESGQACGCLIGTAALAAGFRARKSHFGNCMNQADSYGFLAKRISGFDEDDLNEVGVQVAGVSRRFYSQTLGFRSANTSTKSDARTVHLLRQRIARQLAIRESAGEQPARLPNEPVESVPLPAPTALTAEAVENE